MCHNKLQASKVANEWCNIPVSKKIIKANVTLSFASEIKTKIKGAYKSYAFDGNALLKIGCQSLNAEV